MKWLIVLISIIHTTYSDKYVVDVVNNKFTIDGVSQDSLDLSNGLHTFIVNGLDNHPFKFSDTEDGIHNGGTEYTEGVRFGNNIVIIEILDSTPNLWYYCDNHQDMGEKAHEIGCDLCNYCTHGTTAENCWWKHDGKTETDCPIGGDCSHKCNTRNRCEEICTKLCNPTPITIVSYGQTDMFKFSMQSRLKTDLKSRGVSTPQWMTDTIDGGFIRKSETSKDPRKEIMKSLLSSDQNSVTFDIKDGDNVVGKHVFKRRRGMTKLQKKSERPTLNRSDKLSFSLKDSTDDDGWETFEYQGTNYDLFIDDSSPTIQKSVSRRTMRRLSDDISDCFILDASDFCELVDGEYECDIPGDVDVQPGCTINGDTVAKCQDGTWTNPNGGADGDGLNQQNCDYCIAGYGGNPCVPCVNGTFNSDISNIGTGCSDMACGLGQGAVHNGQPQTSEFCEDCSAPEEYSETSGTGQCIGIPSGYACSSANTQQCSSIEQTVCSTSQRVQNNECVDCETGLESSSEASASGPDTTCTVDIDGCIGHSCVNGNCVDEVAPSLSYTCDCTGSGFSGDNCDVAEPCTTGANGQVCQYGVATGTTGNCGCTCIDNYYGDNCEFLDCDTVDIIDYQNAGCCVDSNALECACLSCN